MTLVSKKPEILAITKAKSLNNKILNTSPLQVLQNLTSKPIKATSENSVPL